MGLVLRGAAATPVDAALLAPARALLGLSSPEVLRYQDAAAQQDRALRVHREADGAAHLQGFWLAGDASGETWLRQLLENDEALPGPAHLLLAPGDLARSLMGDAATPASPQVCTCFNVREDAIRQTLGVCVGTPEERLAGLMGQLRCGTNCGSCIPALRSLVKAVPLAPRAVTA